MSNAPQHQPYQTLGNHLRYLREQHLESLAEVSGAVEIDEKLLASIEAGQERPAEEILFLLISHFDMQDQEAGQLWELAGYHESASAERRKQEDLLQDALSGSKPVIVVVGMEGRTLYTDDLVVDTNAGGIVLNFGQLNSKQLPQTIAKVGMSYDQAEAVLQQIQHALLYAKHSAQPKLLPPSNNDSESKN